MDVPDTIQYRAIVAHTPLEGQLAFRSMTGSEGLSRLFEFDVELIADNYNLDLDALLGKPLTLEMETQAGSRFLDGHVTRCEMIGRESGTSRHYIYRATVRPWLWYLTQTSDSKIFQKKTIPDVINEVLAEHGFAFESKLTGSYRTWEYCVQYQETDFAFISRLMEHEGIYYYFKHDKGQHTLVMIDDVGSHDQQAGYEDIPYYGPDRLVTPQDEYISMWEVAAAITPDSYATVDYDPIKPGASLDAVSRQPGGSQSGNLEMYEWQGGFQEPDQAEQYSKIRLQELQTHRKQGRGMGSARKIAPGYLFTLKNHPRAAENREYLVVSANYRMNSGGHSTGSGSEFFWETSFVVLPTSQQYRAPRTSPVPHTHGPQTAKVVGPAGEEIWTDEYGRIKVQFHWDRYGQKNENSSCWVRVSSPWAGGGFGGLQLPRINDEVVVDFIGGCPDRPLILGRVYNGNNMPPVDLPASATQSGFRSQSVHGDPSMSNRMIFDDKLGLELFHTRAQRNMLNDVVNDHDHHVGNNHCQNVGVDHTHTVGKNHTQTIGCNHTIEVGEDLKTTIKRMEERLVKAEQKITVMKDATQTFQGQFTKTVTGLEKRITEARQEITVQQAALHTYNTTLTQLVTANHDLKVQADQSTEVLGEMKIESGRFWKSVKGSSFDTTIGAKFTAVVGTNTSLYAAPNISMAPVSVSTNGASFTLNGASATVVGKTLSTAGQKAKLAATEQRLVGIENGVAVARSRTAALARITRGVKMAQSGIKQDLNGVKNNISTLDNRVSALESHA
ncbi:type VI secretion system Vgr family protein [Bordetella genomosp. 13]|uniref:type VI secretion system Vgr family protein n=1 Tax=Bordetella genomosp. 13 TaxID=463040 RepID=UPI0011A7D7F4|nr:type VI secretion system tip protein TssI/VgrG [Bordetella genomosp. 13]